MEDTTHDFENYSGIAYSDVTDSLYVVDNQNDNATAPGNHILTYTNEGVWQDLINMVGFNDVESIIHMGGDRFAVVEERDQTDPTDDDHEFDITIIEIDGSGDDIVKSQSEKTITVIDDLLTDGDGNQRNRGMEGLAYDPVTKYFYFAKEKEDVEIFRVHEDTEVLQIVTITGVTSTNSGILGDISDIHFVRTPDALNGRLILLSDDSEKVIMADLAADGVTGTVLVDGAENPYELATPTDDYEGIAFSPGGYLMWLVLDGPANTMLRYRNFTALTPDAAPDLDAASDTGMSNTDNITTDLTPSFSGTLARTAGTSSVPVEDAWVWLYANGVQTGSAVEVDTDQGQEGDYTVTAGGVCGNDLTFTIKAGESSSTAEADRSIASAGLDVDIAMFGDLTGDCAVDFDDLTILLAHWGQNATEAEGNLVDAANTPVNFEDLTVLLAAWTTGPGGAPSPEATSVWPDEGDTPYSASINVYIEFSEEVQGVDASDLELSGLGGIEATVGTPTNIEFTDVWQFPVTGLLPGAVDAVLAIDEDDITDMDNNSVEPKYWQFIVDPGLWLNESGSGDVALSADFLGLSSTAVTVEVTFVSDAITSGTGAGTPIFAYATDDEQDAFTLFIEKDAPNNMKLYVNGASVVLASGTDVTDLFDGVKYHLAVTYNSSDGKARAFVDGTAIGTEQTFGTPTTVDDGSDNKGGTFFLGQEPDNETGPGFGFDVEQIFQGSILEVRIYDEVRTPTEISTDSTTALDPTALPAELVHAWEFRGAGGIVSGGDMRGTNHFEITHQGVGLILNDGTATEDVALVSDFLGFSSAKVTVELTFASFVESSSGTMPLFSYATTAEPEAFILYVQHSSNKLKFNINGTVRMLVQGAVVESMFDGAPHHIAMTYDSAAALARFDVSIPRAGSYALSA